MRAYAAVAPAKAAARSERQSTAGKSEILRREREWAHFVVGSYSQIAAFPSLTPPRRANAARIALAPELIEGPDERRTDRQDGERRAKRHKLDRHLVVVTEQQTDRRPP